MRQSYKNTKIPNTFYKADTMLQKLRPENFDKVYEILQEAFPLDERRPYDEQKALLSDPQYSIYVLPNTENREIKAFVSVYQFKEFAYIEHFATNSEYRNQGLGSLLLNELSDLLRCKMCLEVELPETELAKRRIDFYKRNGFYVNAFAYTQPPISRGKKSIPLIIMTTGGRASKREFEEIKEILYKKVYKIT